MIRWWDNNLSVALYNEYVVRFSEINMLPKILEFFPPQEVVMWCRENKIKYRTEHRKGKITSLLYPVMKFYNREDATAFRLRWE